MGPQLISGVPDQTSLHRSINEQPALPDKADSSFPRAHACRRMQYARAGEDKGALEKFCIIFYARVIAFLIALQDKWCMADVAPGVPLTAQHERAISQHYVIVLGFHLSGVVATPRSSSPTSSSYSLEPDKKYKVSVSFDR